jgi:two-component system OmpR family sensor kinase
MDIEETEGTIRQTRLLTTLEGLLAIRAPDVKSALTEACQLVAEALSADKVDVFLYDPTIDTLIAEGTSDTPMGHLQHRLGLHRLPLSNGGNASYTFRTGEPHHSGHVDQDPNELLGIREGLGVRSAMGVPLDVDEIRRGVVQVDSAQPEWFPAEDIEFLKAVAHWIGMVLHRAEMTERIAREVAEETRRVAADELIAVLAHDLRAPLTPVRGYLDMIVREAEKGGHPTYLTYARSALRGTGRLLRMIDNLLDAARLDQGLFVVVPEAVDIASLMRETALLLQTPQHPIEVVGDEAIVVECDSHRIQQVIENLVSNALRHSPDDAPVVLEGRCEQHEGKTWAVVTVQDKGTGIPAEILPQIFTRFARGKSTHGLGLGLYLARGIAEAHKGTLTVESKLGTGATFRLALPVPMPLD